MTNREQICKQQVHCLSCPLSIRITGKDCRTLTQKELIEHELTRQRNERTRTQSIHQKT